MIRMIQRILTCNPSTQTVGNGSGTQITRRWVETGDERCPLACVWFALPEIAADEDDDDQRSQRKA